MAPIKRSNRGGPRIRERFSEIARCELRLSVEAQQIARLPVMQDSRLLDEGAATSVKFATRVLILNSGHATLLCVAISGLPDTPPQRHVLPTTRRFGKRCISGPPILSRRLSRRPHAASARVLA